MTVADHIINYLVSEQIKHVFLITGGAIAFTVDAFHGRKDIDYICMQHEQAAAMAAEAYSRMGPGLGVAMATSGPGATNLITGICCAWFDSIPTLYITGQVNSNELTKNSKVRQTGFQETNIVDIVKPITKFAVQVKDPSEIKAILEEAVFIAKSGRPGPVLVDIPINVQYAKINSKSLRGYNSKEKNINDFHSKISQIINLIKKSQRPVLLLGFGIRLAKAENELKKLLRILKIPVVTTWSGLDLIPYDNLMRVGQSGVYGDRAANYAIQNSDLLISIGARLDTRQTSNPSTYAREAVKVAIDIDRAELTKKSGLKINIAIEINAKEFLIKFLSRSEEIKTPDISNWQKTIITWKKKYSILKNEHFIKNKYVDPYIFAKTLSNLLPNNAIIIPDEGGNLCWTVQGIRLKNGQRLFSAFGNSPMGYALSASIGACFATNKKRPVVCITGDGGLQINIQELQTIIHHKLPIKIFILNNKCYGIIKQFQDTWLNSRYEASQKGYSSPDFIEVAKAYGFKTVTIKNHRELSKQIKKVLSTSEPVFCDVLLDPDQKIIPKIDFGMPLEDMTPPLSRREFRKNMIVKPLAKSFRINSS